ncbi:MAG TPA: glycosyltransferase family 4 protein [Chitinophagaceae bacterium]|nr:glycosyltransferase family 4 protein [Chitinophagaceae bacterium]
MRTVVSIVSYHFLPAVAGGQKAIAIFHKYLAKRVRLICVSVQNNDASKAEGYELRKALSDSRLRYINPFYFFTLRRVLKQTGASALLIEQPYYGWLASLLKWFTGTYLIVRSHNIESLRFRSVGKWWWRIMWWYERFTHRRAHLNIFIQDQDREYAIRHFGLDASRCVTVLYGVEWNEPPPATERHAASQQLRIRHNIPSGDTILLFNGAFNYKPNLEALQRIIDTIHPILQKAGLRYHIIICGKDIPSEIMNKKGLDPGIIIAGFVDDIGLYLKGSDIFLNPVIGGGGIKTKLVEALAYNLHAVSTADGAIGIDPEVCGGKLLIAPDNAWDVFCDKVVAAARLQGDIPPAFFRHFDWDAAIQRLMEHLENKKTGSIREPA